LSIFVKNNNILKFLLSNKPKVIHSYLWIKIGHFGANWSICLSFGACWIFTSR